MYNSHYIFLIFFTLNAYSSKTCYLSLRKGVSMFYFRLNKMKEITDLNLKIIQRYAIHKSISSATYIADKLNLTLKHPHKSTIVCLTFLRRFIQTLSKHIIAYSILEHSLYVSASANINHLTCSYISVSVFRFWHENCFAILACDVRSRIKGVSCHIFLKIVWCAWICLFSHLWCMAVWNTTIRIH